MLSCNSERVVIKGDITSDIKEVYFGQTGGIIQKIEINNGKFELRFNGLIKGYYKINNILVFLAPGFDLEIDISKDTVIFSGKGSPENNLLRQIDHKEEVLSTKSSLFFEKIKLKPTQFNKFLDEYIDWLNTQTKNGKYDKEFVKLEKQKAKLINNSLQAKYVLLHGTDFNDTRLFDYIATLKPEDYNNPKIMAKYDSIRKEVDKNKLPKEEISRIRNEIFKNLDVNDDLLLKIGSKGFERLVDEKLMTYAYQRFANHSSKSDPTDLTQKTFIPVDNFYRDIILDSIRNKIVKEYFLCNVTQRIIKATPEYAKEAFEIFSKNNQNKVYDDEVNQVYNKYLATAAGRLSPKFSNYENPKGERVSLDDFKGKYVYIDVWATWCSPCKKEIPFLKKIEEKYHDKNIVFISISVDDIKSKKLWQNMVKAKQLGGVQLIADKSFESEFISAYNINSIPRFILLDPNGKIISANAKRPSDPKLIEVLNSLNLK